MWSKKMKYKLPSRQAAPQPHLTTFKTVMAVVGLPAQAVRLMHCLLRPGYLLRTPRLLSRPEACVPGCG